MKFVIFSILMVAPSAFAKQVTPKSFGVQYLAESITGEPFVNYSVTVSAKDFPSMNFGQLSVKLIDNNNGSLIVSPRVVYAKSPGTTIVGSEVTTFSFKKLEALYNLKNLKLSSLVFDADDGSSFSINLSELCVSNPINFMNLNGGSGCDVNAASIDNAIKELESRARDSGPTLVCNEIEELKPFSKLFCSSDMQKTRERAENEFGCLFKCE